MAADDPVPITCAISGAVGSRERCPASPYTPAEYAAAARRAVDEGAGRRVATVAEARAMPA
jgi:uncharacterized protein (DUF849 family)